MILSLLNIKAVLNFYGTASVMFLLSTILLCAEVRNDSTSKDQQIKEPTDSLQIENKLKEYTVGNIRVDGKRPIQSISLSSSPLYTIDSETLLQKGSDDVSDAIQLSPGVFVQDYGGAAGMKSISVRGATSAQTIILLDGFPINSNQTGSLDLSFLPANMFSEITVVRGGSSALNGSNAIGGAVNLITKIVSDDQYNASLKYGSFSSSILQAGTTQRFGDFGLASNIEYLSSEGNFPYSAQMNGEEQEFRRQNADIERISANLYGDYVGDNYIWTTRMIFSNADKGVPGAVIGNSSQNDKARYETNNFLVLSNFQLIDISSTRSNSYNFGLMFLHNDDAYSNPDAFGVGTKNNYIGNDFRARFKLESNANTLKSFFSDYILIAELTHSALNGDMLDPDVGSFVDRSNYAVAGAITANILTEKYNLHRTRKKLEMQGACRYDGYSDIANAVSPSLGLIYHIYDYNEEVLLVKGEYSYNFRAPAFNEMYYLNYGNSDLNPEKSHSYNLGIEFIPPPNKKFTFNLGVNAFILMTKDQIVAVPKSPISWSAENIGEVFTRGIEWNLSVTPNIEKKTTYSISYSYQLALDRSENSPSYNKKVPYIPEEMLSFFGIYDFGNEYLAGINVYYSSHRYALADNSYESLLKHYATLDLFCSKNFKFDQIKVTARIDAKNIFNEKYSIIKNYPMPGRYFRLGISANFTEQ
jgi:vitamin B12 transporter